MKKTLIALLLPLLFLSCVKNEPSTEQKLSSENRQAVLSGLTDMWRKNDAVNMASAAVLLDKKDTGEQAAFALSNISAPAVNNIVLSGMNDGKDNDARLLYYCLSFKTHPVDDFIVSRSAAHYGKYKGEALTAINLIAGGQDTALKAAASFEKKKIFLNPALSREFILRIGEQRYPRLYDFLSSVYLTHRELRPFAEWAMHRIKKSGRIKYDFKDRVIVKNGYFSKDSNNPVIPTSAGTYKAWHTANPDILVKDDELYFYYRTGNGTDRISLMTVPLQIFNGTNMLDYPNNPIIGTSQKGFDSRGVLDPSAVVFNGKIFLYYSGLGDGEDSVGLAVSKDGNNFTKYEKNPVLTGRAPDVIIKDGILYMYYVVVNEARGYSIYLATSSDGYNFIPFGTSPVFAPDDTPGAWDGKSVTTPRITEKDGVYYMLYCGDDKYRDYPPFFGLAFSYDMIHWYRSTQNPVFSRGKKNDFDDGTIWFGDLFPYNNKWYLYYEGWGGGASHGSEYGAGGHSQIGMATGEFDIAQML
jgi:predicted GH43/DUF377 family glycosyl hydrolase